MQACHLNSTSRTWAFKFSSVISSAVQQYACISECRWPNLLLHCQGPTCPEPMPHMLRHSCRTAHIGSPSLPAALFLTFCTSTLTCHNQPYSQQLNFDSQLRNSSRLQACYRQGAGHQAAKHLDMAPRRTNLQQQALQSHTTATTHTQRCAPLCCTYPKVISIHALESCHRQVTAKGI